MDFQFTTSSLMIFQTKRRSKRAKSDKADINCTISIPVFSIIGVKSTKNIEKREKNADFPSYPKQYQQISHRKSEYSVRHPNVTNFGWLSMTSSICRYFRPENDRIVVSSKLKNTPKQAHDRFLTSI